MEAARHTGTTQQQGQTDSLSSTEAESHPIVRQPESKKPNLLRVGSQLERRERRHEGLRADAHPGLCNAHPCKHRAVSSQRTGVGTHNQHARHATRTARTHARPTHCQPQTAAAERSEGRKRDLRRFQSLELRFARSCTHRAEFSDTQADDVASIAESKQEQSVSAGELTRSHGASHAERSRNGDNAQRSYHETAGSAHSLTCSQYTPGLTFSSSSRSHDERVLSCHRNAPSCE